MARILCFLYENMADFQITFTCHLLKFFGDKHVVFVGENKRSVKGMSGIMFEPEISLSEIGNLAEVEALIIPGGWSYHPHPELVQLIKQMNQAGKLIAAICSAPYFLAKADILTGRCYTTSLSAQSLKELGEEEDPFPWESFRGEGVVKDGNLITAQSSFFIDFGVEIYDSLGLYTNKEDKETCRNHFKGIS